MKVQVWVEDNGRGIEPELRELVFDKFFQAKKSDIENRRAAGSGLAIRVKDRKPPWR